MIARRSPGHTIGPDELASRPVIAGRYLGAGGNRGQCPDASSPSRICRAAAVLEEAGISLGIGGDASHAIKTRAAISRNAAALVRLRGDAHHPVRPGELAARRITGEGEQGRRRPCSQPPNGSAARGIDARPGVAEMAGIAVPRCCLAEKSVVGSRRAGGACADANPPHRLPPHPSATGRAEHADRAGRGRLVDHMELHTRISLQQRAGVDGVRLSEIEHAPYAAAGHGGRREQRNPSRSEHKGTGQAA